MTRSIFLTLLMLVIVAAMGSYFLFRPSTTLSKQYCERLLAIAKNEQFKVAMIEWVDFLNSNPTILKKSKKELGAINISLIEGNLGLNTKRLGFLDQAIVVTLNGENMNYQEYTPGSVETIGIGFSYRTLIYFGVNKPPLIPGYFADRIIDIDEDVKVLCYNVF